MSESSDPVAERDRALALLKGHHTFPGPFVFRVVVRPQRRAEAVSAVGAVMGEGSVRTVDEKPSRNGTYLSVRVHVVAPSAESVLDTYAVLGQVDGVLAVM
jgi:putative lipoic acid-binding regulatory protein